jgi:hypothetical protein
LGRAKSRKTEGKLRMQLGAGNLGEGKEDGAGYKGFLRD